MVQGKQRDEWSRTFAIMAQVKNRTIWDSKEEKPVNIEDFYPAFLRSNKSSKPSGVKIVSIAEAASILGVKPCP